MNYAKSNGYYPLMLVITKDAEGKVPILVVDHKRIMPKEFVDALDFLKRNVDGSEIVSPLLREMRR